VWEAGSGSNNYAAAGLGGYVSGEVFYHFIFKYAS